MFRSVYDYLQLELSSAVNLAFPDIVFSRHDVSINVVPEHFLYDLSSSVALKIDAKNVDFSTAARNIASLINYDSHFVQNDFDNSFTCVKGFINFKLSHKYISAVINELTQLTITIPDSVTDPIILSSFSITKAVLSQTSKIVQEFDLSAPDPGLLCTPEELRIGRFLGTAPLFYDCRKFNNRVFFKRRIAEAFLKFYNKTRIMTPDYNLTSARLSLVKATQHALLIL